MDTTTRNIFTVMSVLVVVSIFLTYDRAVVRKDYTAFPPEPEEEAAPLEESVPLEIPPDVEAASSGESTSTTP